MRSPVMRPGLRRAAFALALLPLPLLAARAPAARLVSAVTVVVGRVTDGHGNPVAQAQLRVADRGAAATAAVDGRYALRVPRTMPMDEAERVTIHVARIGFQPRDVAVELRGDTVRTDIQLTPASMRLESVVTTATGASATTAASAPLTPQAVGSTPLPTDQPTGTPSPNPKPSKSCSSQ